MQNHKGNADDWEILSGFDVSQDTKHSNNFVVYWAGSISNYFQNTQFSVTSFLWEEQSDIVFEDYLNSVCCFIRSLVWDRFKKYHSTKVLTNKNWIKILRNNFLKLRLKVAAKKGKPYSKKFCQAY